MIVYRLLSAGALLHLANAQNSGNGGGNGGGNNDSGGDPTKGPIDTCFEQNNCLDVTVNAPTGTTSCQFAGICSFEACITVNFAKNDCRKENGDSISHECDKSDANKCPLADNLWDSQATESGVTSGKQQCQIGAGGSTLQFIYKDGSECEAATTGSAAGTITIGGTAAADASATCRTSVQSDRINPGTKTCTGNDAGKECVWEVTLPNCDACPSYALKQACDTAGNPVITITSDPFDEAGYNFEIRSMSGDVIAGTATSDSFDVAATVDPGTLYELFVVGCGSVASVASFEAVTLTCCTDHTDCAEEATKTECCDDLNICLDPTDSTACGDPHMTGFLGQKFDFTGEDSAWYCLIKDDNMQVSMRVTTPVPSLPEITYITGLSVLTTDVNGSEHDIVVEVRDPYSLESSCPTGVSPCLADGALAVVLDGEETLLAPGTASLGLDVAVSAVNLPGACRSFGFDKYWEMKGLERATVGRRLREEAGMGEWILADPTATNMDECIEYVARAETEAGGVFAHQSEHALFQILTPKASIRLSHGRLHQVAMRDPTDHYDLPEHVTWQMNFAVDHKEVSHAATGILGETFVPTLDSDGNPIMSGMEAIRGTQDDYRVDGPLGVDFVQNTRAL